MGKRTLKYARGSITLQDHFAGRPNFGQVNSAIKLSVETQ